MSLSVISGSVARPKMPNFYYFLRTLNFLFFPCFCFLILSYSPRSSAMGIPGGEQEVAQVAPLEIQSKPPGFFSAIPKKISISSRGSSGYLNQEDETEVHKKLRLVPQAEPTSSGASEQNSIAKRLTPKFILRADSQHGNNSVKKWKKLPQNGNHPIDPPPPPSQVAKMARYIVKNSNWSAMATVSSRDNSGSSPFSNVVSISDGPVDKSTGVPYMYVTPLDLSTKDLKVNPKMSLSMTLAQSTYCQTEEYDPEDPRCARVILSGNFVKLANGTDEATFASLAIFSRHPVMKSWPKDHGFFFAKLDIKQIFVLDYFGGAKTVTPKEYFKAKF